MLKFKQVRDTFPEWTAGQAAAYVAGVMSYYRDETLDTAAALAEWDDDIRHYYRGVADAMGDDAEGEEWFSLITDWRILHCWWIEGRHSDDPADSEE